MFCAAAACSRLWGHPCKPSPPSPQLRRPSAKQFVDNLPIGITLSRHQKKLDDSPLEFTSFENLPVALFVLIGVSFLSLFGVVVRFGATRAEAACERTSRNSPKEPRENSRLGKKEQMFPFGLYLGDCLGAPMYDVINHANQLPQLCSARTP